MVERADITRAKSQAFREGVETVMRARTNGFERAADRIVQAIRADTSSHADWRWARECGWLGRVSSLNGVLAGWLLVGLGLSLNTIEFYTAGRSPLAFSGIVLGIIAVAHVYLGMQSRAGSFMRMAHAASNAILTVGALVCWFVLNKHLWGL